MTDKFWQVGGTRGKGIRIALLDSGINKRHPVFRDKDIVLRDICNPQGNGMDIDGHGTQCAGIILQVAPSCTLLSGRILDRSGHFTYDALLGGMNWALSQKAHIVCVCSGERFEDPDISGKVTKLASAGCCTVAAIGNHGRTGMRAGVYPARCADALAVGSADATGILREYTDLPGDKDVFCPAGDTFMAPDLGEAFQEIMGTSASACWIAGIVALHLAGGRPSPTNTELLTRIKSCSTPHTSARGSYWVFDPEKFLIQAS